MMRLYIKEPLAILNEAAAGGLVIEDDKIIEIVPSGARPQCHYDESFDASEHVILPGLINTHHHFFQTLTRAHPQAINKELFHWLQALYPIWAAHMTPEAFRLACRLAIYELMMSGCTTTSDHHYLFPVGLEDAIDIQIDEARRAGIRMTVSRGSMNFDTSKGGLPPKNLVQDEDVILADCERLLSQYHQNDQDPMLKIALAPCAPFTVTQRLMRESAVLARKHNCRLHTHLGETADENEYCLAHFNCRPVEYLESCDWLNERVWLAHGVVFTPDEIARLGSAKVGISHCPTSNMILASGQCRTHDLEQAGCPLGLGVDGSASNDSSNIMESVRHALLINRLTYGSARVSHHDVLRWATMGSARCLGRDDIGEIRVGAMADLALYRLDELRFSGAGDPLAALVLCGAQQADRVMIAGRWTIIDGHPPNFDIARLRAEHGQIAKMFLKSDIFANGRAGQI